MTFIYFCVDPADNKLSFTSKAFIEPGNQLPAEDGSTLTIVDFDVEQHISCFEDRYKY